MIRLIMLGLVTIFVAASSFASQSSTVKLASYHTVDHPRSATPQRPMIMVKPSRAGPSITTVPTKQTASSSLLCGDIVYKVNTGTGGGTCQKNVSTGVVTCSDGGNKAIASCKNGCTYTTGSGSCDTSKP